MSGDSLALMRALPLPDGRRWGEVATAWQLEDAQAILDRAGRRRHFCTRPRGGSKTTDLAAIVLVILLTQAPPGAALYWFAVDQQQAQLGLNAIRGMMARSRELARLLELKVNQVTTRTGATLTVAASDGASAFGLLPYLVVLDEMCQWPSTRNHRDVLFPAIMSALPKVADSRAVILSSAGEPSHWTAKLMDHARTSDEWRVSEVPGPLPWWSEADLVEQQAILSESQYARLILNRWTEAEDRLTTVDAIAACVRHSGVLPPVKGVDYVMGLDIGIVNDRTVLAVGHAERLEDHSVRVVLDRMDVWTPSKGRPVDLIDVAGRAAAVSYLYGRARLIYDPSQAQHMAAVLRAQGVRAQQFNFTPTSVGQLGMTLYRLLQDRLLDLPHDELLIDELANVRLRESSPGVLRLDHDAGRHDDRAVALALLAHALLETRHRGRGRIVHTSTLGVEW